jgi:hypothetical protein
MPACWPAHPPSLSHTPPSLFPDKKIPVQAHFWLDELFYYIDYDFYFYIFFDLVELIQQLCSATLFLIALL